MGLDEALDDLGMARALPQRRPVELVIEEAFTVQEVRRPDDGMPIKTGRLLRDLMAEITDLGGIEDVWGFVHPADLSPWAGRDPDDTYLRTLFRPLD